MLATWETPLGVALRASHGFPSPSSTGNRQVPRPLLQMVPEIFQQSIASKFLLFGFFVFSVCPAPFAVLFQFNFASDKFPVLAGPVIHTVAFGTSDSD